jgi:hypothetical protein
MHHIPSAVDDATLPNLEIILLHVHPLLGSGLAKKFPRRQILGKQSVPRSRNNRMNVYSSLLGNSQGAKGLARQLSRDLFSVWSAPCPVLTNRTANTSTISVFYEGPCRRFIGNSEGRLQSNPCGGGIEYLHRNPASRRRRRKGKSKIWDSKIWSRVARNSDPRKTALAKASSM